MKDNMSKKDTAIMIATKVNNLCRLESELLSLDIEVMRMEYRDESFFYIHTAHNPVDNFKNIQFNLSKEEYLKLLNDRIDKNKKQIIEINNLLENLLK